MPFRSNEWYDQFPCSYGAGTKGRIYERLRKRSYRRTTRYRRELDLYWDSNWYPFPEDEYGEAAHNAYLAGVRDALNSQELR